MALRKTISIGDLRKENEQSQQQRAAEKSGNGTAKKG